MGAGIIELDGDFKAEQMEVNVGAGTIENSSSLDIKEADFTVGVGSVVHLFRMKVCGAGRMLALGPYLSVGIFIAALWGNGMIDWYLGLFM